jgi:CO/xanthine dehydrogenase FAD-binding subunit
MRDGRRKPATVVDLGGLGLGGIEKKKGGWSIGATTTMTELQELVSSDGSSGGLAILAQAASRLGAHQIQNRATVGGNICNASPAADSACALLALEAEAHLIGPSGKRKIPLADFFVGPGETQMARDELLESVWVPHRAHEPEARVRWDYVKVGGRTSLVCAIASMAAYTVLKEGKIVFCSIALGSVAPTCLRTQSCAEMLEGKVLKPALAKKAARAAREEASPIDDLRASATYRLDVVEAMVTDHLTKCLELAEKGDQ